MISYFLKLNFKVMFATISWLQISSSLNVSSVPTTNNLAYNKQIYHETILKQDDNFLVDGKCLRHTANLYYSGQTDDIVIDLAKRFLVKRVIMQFHDVGSSIVCNYTPKITLGNEFRKGELLNKSHDYEECVQTLTDRLQITFECPNDAKYFKYVEVTLPPRNSYACGICELEVFGENLNEEDYIGCYENNTFRFSIPMKSLNNTNSVDECAVSCRDNDYLYAFLKNGSECYCGNELVSTSSTKHCNISCPDHKHMCGGVNHLSGYNARHSNTMQSMYRGCYKDFDKTRVRYIFSIIVRITKDFLKSMKFENLSNEVCMRHCHEQNFSFFGMQNSDECLCGNSYGYYGRTADNECDMPCAGNPEQKCGASLRNSVYSICFNSDSTQTCDEYNHCASDSHLNNYMVCEPQICQMGWKGPACDERDCQVNNGNCGFHSCETGSIGTKNISECVCLLGYFKSTIHDQCSDLDECSTQMHNCNSSSQLCLNTHGSHQCFCKPGFNVSSAGLLCQDINECQWNPCKNPHEICFNTYGSYLCECSPDYVHFNGSCQLLVENKSTNYTGYVVIVILLIACVTTIIIMTRSKYMRRALLERFQQARAVLNYHKKRLCNLKKESDYDEGDNTVDIDYVGRSNGNNDYVNLIE